jgi:hypothetical protein
MTTVHHVHTQLGKLLHDAERKGLVMRNVARLADAPSAASSELPAHLVGREWPVNAPQNLREYDPEWGRATSSGTLMAGCDHASMLSTVKVPVLLTHHFFQVVESAGHVQGALSDLRILNCSLAR